MKYKDMTPEQKERVFAEDVLGWELMKIPGTIDTHWYDGKQFRLTAGGYRFLTDLNHAMMGVEKFVGNGFFFTLENTHINNRNQWFVHLGKIAGRDASVLKDAPNEAIVECCVRIKRPDLFEGE